MTEYEKIKGELGKQQVDLVAVSKTFPTDRIKELYQKGQRTFGENKVQELTVKQSQLPEDIKWHFIGHLQKNKVKYISSFIGLIHSVDSIGLAKEIDKRAGQNNRIIDILLQIKVAEEDSKYGISPEDLDPFVKQLKDLSLTHVRVCGIMGMGTFTSDEKKTREEFKEIRAAFQTIKSAHFSDDDAFSTVSMGMSGDYKIAIEEGSTMVRIGSLIFGHRNYNK